MEKIPKAIEYCKSNLTDYWDGGKAQYIEEEVEKVMIEFAKLHVQQALKEASEKVDCCTEETLEYSIINAYSLENIK